MQLLTAWRDCGKRSRYFSLQHTSFAAPSRIGGLQLQERNMDAA